MFDFRRLELVHWDYWQRFTVPLGSDIITVVGPNGSGKTTLLDALRTLLAIDCSGNRDYKRYVRHSGQAFGWLRAVVGNERQPNGRLPFFPIMSNDVTLGCRIRKKGGDWERHYFIGSGDIPLEELESKAEFIGVREYRLRLQDAGLTQAICRVLSLEQGETDKLCQLSPKALLDLVFDVFGDKRVLDDYQRAKDEQQEIARELGNLDTQLAQLGIRLEELKAKVRSYEEWQGLKRELLDLETEILPTMQLQEYKAGIAGGRPQRLGQKRQQRELRLGVAELERAISEIDNEIAGIEQVTTGLDADEKEAERLFIEAHGASIRLDALVGERDRLVRLARKETTRDPVALTHDLSAKRTDLARLDLDAEQDAGKKRELEAQIAAWAAGRWTVDFEREFREALDHAGIAHRMLTEIVECRDEGWQAAMEAVLNPYRHLVLLTNPDDARRAWELGERMRYRHFVVAEREAAGIARKESLLEVVSFAEAPPAWLPRLLDDIQRVENVAEGTRLPRQQAWITRGGYFRERRGGRHAAAESFHFGEGGRQRRREEAEKALNDLLRTMERRARRRTELAVELSELEALLAGLDASKQLAARAEEFRAAEGRKEAADKARAEKEGLLRLAQAATKEAGERRHAKALDRQKVEIARQKAQEELKKLEEQANRDRQQQVQRIKEYRALRAKLPPRWREPENVAALRQKWKSAGSVELEIGRLRQKLETGDWETDETVIARRDKVKADHEALATQIAERGAHLARARAATDDARDAYINVLHATVRLYRSNVEELGKLAGIGVEVESPRLANDDVVLAQAGLPVKFEFDEKGMIGLDDGEASGGQQVMKSLLLLVGLMRDPSRPGGFVFIDEPFAHLDIFNIDRVGAFLSATRAQYILTTPNTHNVNVFKPSDLTLVTHKRKGRTGWAPPLAVLTRARPAASVPGLE